MLREVGLLLLLAFSAWSIVRYLFADGGPAVFDYIVVGGGSTGAVVAGRLGEAGYSVLVLEAGGSTQISLGGDAEPVAGKWTIFDVPLGWVQVLSDHRWSKEFQWVVPADPPPAIARGLGGCGIHNAMLYMRGRPADFAEWGAGWSWDDVLPFYKRSEDNEQFGSSPLHGTGGPVRVTTVASDELSDFFLDAFSTAGLPHVEDFNGPDRIGFGRYQFMIRDGLRDSAAAAFLGADRRAGYRAPPLVKTHALATRLVVEGRRVVGVEYVRGRAPTDKAKRLRAMARHEVVLSAGAVMTPKLLLLSGVGEAAKLRRLGITLVYDNPAVGRGLADGVYAIMQWATRKRNFFKCRLGTQAEEDQPHADYCAQQRAMYAAGHRSNSSLGSPGMSVGAFLRSPYAKGPEPDLQLTVHPWDKFSRPWSKRLVGVASMEIANNHPASRGWVELRSSRFTDPPLFAGPYLRDANDSRPLQWAMRQVRRIAGLEPMAQVVQEEILPGKHAVSDAQLFDAIACGPAQFRTLGRPACDRSELPVNHLAGTARLGDPSDPRAVVDRYLRVIGVHGLRVADASVMPAPPSGNTHATCVMIGERAAQFIIDERQSRRRS